MNVFLKKTMASAHGLTGEQVEAILNAAEAFKSNEIDRASAIEVFNKLAKKTPQELNDLLKSFKTML